MRYRQAREMLGEAFGPGDLQNKIEELQPVPKYGTFSMENCDKLMDWMAEQLDDEGEGAEQRDAELTSDESLHD
jgi:hypothetical protein